jgi:hypothetical protein
MSRFLVAANLGQCGLELKPFLFFGRCSRQTMGCRAALTGGLVMLETGLYPDPRNAVPRHIGIGQLTAVEREPWEEILHQEDRIREVFQLAADIALPCVTMATLARFHAHLARYLTFPFQALYADTHPPVRQLVRYITVTGLVHVAGSASRGIHCRVEGVPGVRELPLVDIGLQEDNPNCQLVDDYAYWFLNSW